MLRYNQKVVVLKQCVDCKKYKEQCEFVKDKNKPDGTRNRCKACENLKRRKTPLVPKAKIGYKVCAKCKEEKVLSEFNVRMIYKKKRPFSYCKDCERKINNNKYLHKCSECGDVYKSGKKDSKICYKCRNKIFANTGAEFLRKYNAIPQNNYWYGKPRIGEENPNYNFQKTDEERENGRLIMGYTEWRNSVYQRDNYTCVCCKDDKGGKLNAHHIESYDWCREKRLDLQNGVTLCETCHTEFHKTFGFGGNTKEQFKQFMKQHANTEVSNQITQG